MKDSASCACPLAPPAKQRPGPLTYMLEAQLVQPLKTPGL